MSFVQEHMSQKGSSSDAAICAICLEVVYHGVKKGTTTLACGHQFHLGCITSAFSAKEKMECPVCRDIEESDWKPATSSRNRGALDNSQNSPSNQNAPLLGSTSHSGNEVAAATSQFGRRTRPRLEIGQTTWPIASARLPEFPIHGPLSSHVAAPIHFSIVQRSAYVRAPLHAHFSSVPGDPVLLPVEHQSGSYVFDRHVPSRSELETSLSLNHRRLPNGALPPHVTAPIPISIVQQSAYSRIPLQPASSTVRGDPPGPDMFGSNVPVTLEQAASVSQDNRPVTHEPLMSHVAVRIPLPVAQQSACPRVRLQRQFSRVYGDLEVRPVEQPVRFDFERNVAVTSEQEPGLSSDDSLTE